MDPEEGPQKLFPSAAFNIRVIHSPFHSYTWPHQSFCLMTISDNKILAAWFHNCSCIVLTLVVPLKKIWMLWSHQTFPHSPAQQKSTADFVVTHSPTLAPVQTHMGAQIMLRGEWPLLSPVTLKDPSKAPLDELSSKRSPIKSRMSWPESRTSKTLKIQGWWAWICVFGTRSH